MPEPIGRDQRYMPGLDGVRAVAVIAVVLFHLGYSWLPGGLLGVSVFFTLSGYLITDLLLNEWRSSGRLQLGDFWLRRARRLLPALFLMLAVVVVWVAIGDRSQLGALRGDTLSAVFYVNNWWLIFHHVSYFARFGPPSPLGNLWSLAVEEQFYLVWPWFVLVGLFWLNRGVDDDRPRSRARQMARRRGVLVAITLAMAVASALEMALLYHPSLDPTRLYDGTDTRAFGLLFGAALAIVWPSRHLRADVTPGARWLLDGMGVAGLVGIVLLMWRTTQYSAFLYRGGMALLSVATVLVIVSASHPATRVSRVLGWGPLRWIGLWSYGIYLWHYPIIVLTTPTVTATAGAGVDQVRVLVQVVAIVVIAALSWRFVETPIRHGALGRWWRRVRSHGVAGASTPAGTRLAGALSVAGLAVTAIAFFGVFPAAPAGTLAAAPPATQSGAATVSRRVRVTPTVPPAVRPQHRQGQGRGPGSHPGSHTGNPASTVPGSPSGTGLTPTSTTTPAPSPMTSCTSVVHIGDSTSESLISSDYLDPSQQLPAQYGRVGVGNVVLEVSGARSIVETLPGQQNGAEVAQGLISEGYHGCWVIALGTNDAANIAAGSPVSASSRIQQMLSIIGNQPVMWVNVVSLLDSGPYAEANMQAWNQALVAACPSDPNMRVYDWASVAQPAWFISDGIHYTSAGSAVRAADIANALAAAFPDPPPKHHHRASGGCVVH